MNDDECCTWRQLRDRINAMPEERLDDPIQILRSDPRDCVQELEVGISLRTIGEFGCETRNVIDNTHNPEHYALLTDMNPFDEDGNFYYEETPEGLIGNKTGKNYGPGIFSEGDERARLGITSDPEPTITSWLTQARIGRSRLRKPPG